MLSKLEWFLKLIKENPQLPVIPVVSGDVIDDKENNQIGYSDRWMGNLGDAEIVMYIKGETRINIYGDCNFEKTLIDCKKFTESECKKLSAEQLEEEYSKLPWQEAIFVNIDWIE